MPRQTNIYLDTVLWNVLYDHGVRPEKIRETLGTKNASLVPGTHVFYELAKNFGNPEGFERGKQLFSFFSKFIDAKTPCVKDNRELLAAEMHGVKYGPQAIEPFLSEQDRASIKQEVEKLATGVFEERGSTFLSNQKEFASRTRLGQKLHLQTRSDIADKLKAVSPEDFPKWLQEEAMGAAAVAITAFHIRGMFKDVPASELVEYASALLSVPAKRFARGVVRADLYYNWRCAHRESVPKDVIDDIYHVLNSVYCDVYATAEQRQMEYAKLLVTSNTRIEIYSGGTPVDQWLLSLV